MDSIWVSEAYDLGSIPSKATKKAPQFFERLLN